MSNNKSQFEISMVLLSSKTAETLVDLDKYFFTLFTSNLYYSSTVGAHFVPKCMEQ